MASELYGAMVIAPNCAPASLPRTMRKCEPAERLKVFGANWLFVSVPLPRQDTACKTNPLFGGMSQIIVGLLGWLSMLM